jgi:hypothetical protein
MMFQKVSYIFLAVSLFFCLGCPKNPEEQLAAIPNDEVTRFYVSGAYHFIDARPAEPKSSDAAMYSSVGYKLTIKFPAKAVVDFYQEKLTALGYEPYKNSKITKGKREWGSAVDEKDKEEPCIYRFLADWVKKDKTRVAFLSIDYHSTYINNSNDCGFAPNNNSAYVVITSFPYEWSRQ